MAPWRCPSPPSPYWWPPYSTAPSSTCLSPTSRRPTTHHIGAAACISHTLTPSTLTPAVSPCNEVRREASPGIRTHSAARHRTDSSCDFPSESLCHEVAANVCIFSAGKWATEQWHLAQAVYAQSQSEEWWPFITADLHVLHDWLCSANCCDCVVRCCYYAVCFSSLSHAKCYLCVYLYTYIRSTTYICTIYTQPAVYFVPELRGNRYV